MTQRQEGHIDIERDFLKEIGYSLNSALFIIDRLSEELREQEGLLDNDPEIGHLFSHLLTYLEKVDAMVKRRKQHISENLDVEGPAGKENEKGRSDDSLSREL